MIPHEDIEAFVKVFRDAPRLAEIELRTEGEGVLRLRRSLTAAERPLKKVRKAAPAPTPPSTPVTTEPASRGTQVTSSLVGVFRAATKEVVAIGNGVSVRQVLGFVEVMRLTNEVVAPIAGTITAVYVQDGQPVEYGQPLFEIDPSAVTEE